jgi:hypothetical protein
VPDRSVFRSASVIIDSDEEAAASQALGSSHQQQQQQHWQCVIFSSFPFFSSVSPFPFSLQTSRQRLRPLHRPVLLPRRRLQRRHGRRDGIADAAVSVLRTERWRLASASGRVPRGDGGTVRPVNEGACRWTRTQRPRFPSTFSSPSLLPTFALSRSRLCLSAPNARRASEYLHVLTGSAICRSGEGRGEEMETSSWSRRLAFERFLRRLFESWKGFLPLSSRHPLIASRTLVDVAAGRDRRYEESAQTL